MKLPIPVAALTMHFIALGKTRSAKSSKLRVVVEYLLRRKEHPVIIIDPKGDWWGLKVSADGKGPGFPLVIFGGDHADVPLTGHSGGAVAELLCSGNRSAVLDVSGLTIGERTRFFVDFASALFKHSKGLRYLVPDEVHNFAPKGKIFDPEAGKCLHWANRLASEGQGKGIILLAASQRPQKVHNDFLTSCETLIACKVIHKADRDAIKDWVDGCADGAKGKEVIASLSQLKKPEAWVWSPEVDFGPQLVTWPMFETFDSFKQQDAGAAPPTGWAEVNLEELKSKLATVVQEAEANDPKKLRARITELDGQIAKLQRQSADSKPAGYTHKQIVKASADYERIGFDRGKEYGYVEGYNSALDAIHDFAGKLIRLKQDDVPLVPSLPKPLSPAAAGIRCRTDKPELTRAAPSPVRRPVQAAGSSSLPPVQQKILNALAELEQMGANTPERAMVAFMAGYSHVNSKGFANAIGALNSAGFTATASGYVQLTEAGRDLARAPAAPRTTEELQQRLITMLGGASGRILQPLIDAYPKAMPREDLAASAGYGHVNSKGFANAMGRLSTLGFLHYPARGQVAAKPVLFLE